MVDAGADRGDGSRDLRTEHGGVVLDDKAEGTLHVFQWVEGDGFASARSSAGLGVAVMQNRF